MQVGASIPDTFIIRKLKVRAPGLVQSAGCSAMCEAASRAAHLHESQAEQQQQQHQRSRCLRICYIDCGGDVAPLPLFLLHHFRCALRNRRHASSRLRRGTLSAAALLRAAVGHRRVELSCWATAHGRTEGRRRRKAPHCSSRAQWEAAVRTADHNVPTLHLRRLPRGQAMEGTHLVWTMHVFPVRGQSPFPVPGRGH